ncbi:hypothetical protein C3432_11250 [Citrobacter amalonaticus]|uniref:Uncharacterized protein n=1 Tax=Citrobacter amalonaticus TaxID=35703 RepID=A0A2S4S0M2_CITAM|nr:hypothetical protein C3432_11250 [Citrobacter amalonaticus]POT76016.1 hypothetical protein C3436_00570 [Citrobacter amalonaticus]POU66985.1 hypothetical protein C3430_09450 [Citrobacter amalonaticus]POV05251.1 hypothetical protein C3424_07875 [Citrobacter amalonaticus]
MALLSGPSLGLAPSGPAQTLFKTTTRFVLQLELDRVYIGARNVSLPFNCDYLRKVFPLSYKYYFQPLSTYDS